MNKYDDTDFQIEREESIEYKKGNDTNVGNMDKDIERCEQLIKPEHANWIGISNQLAIAHIVDRVKEVENDLTTVYLKGYADAEEKYKARIKELESKLEEANNKLDLDYVDKNYIPVEKVEYKIEEAKYNKKVGNTAYEYTEEDVWDIVKDELEKLLEDK